jgi:hypothetical protein
LYDCVTSLRRVLHVYVCVCVCVHHLCEERRAALCCVLLFIRCRRVSLARARARMRQAWNDTSQQPGRECAPHSFGPSGCATSLYHTPAEPSSTIRYLTCAARGGDAAPAPDRLNTLSEVPEDPPTSRPRITRRRSRRAYKANAKRRRQRTPSLSGQRTPVAHRSPCNHTRHE